MFSSVSVFVYTQPFTPDTPLIFHIWKFPIYRFLSEKKNEKLRLPPGNNGFPKSNSANIHPTAHTSTQDNTKKK